MGSSLVSCVWVCVGGWVRVWVGVGGSLGRWLGGCGGETGEGGQQDKDVHCGKGDGTFTHPQLMQYLTVSLPLYTGV